ncbi:MULTISPECIES: hypothetical protein [unclassified Paenibacillus]|uniref:hypothetical protein n=1 Tax=unclassified Paenibacillus TaxID=185978 RepID=UPI0008B388D7|nr:MULTISPECIES: hypothetical protein [unclassified Paenibacillus]QLG40902.1 hypothetical protein HW560_24200 [Paenibacillus sp. E222]SEN49462.1 hypothetical protein SAMN05518670_2008 [Paenibacillus sp. OK076]
MTTTLFTIVAIIGFGLITGTITMVMIFKMLRNNKQIQHTRKRVLMEGIPAEAVIHDITQTSSSMDGRPGVRLDLTVTQVDGRTFPSVVETYIPVTHIPQFQKGNVIHVRYIANGNERKVEVEGAYMP